MVKYDLRLGSVDSGLIFMRILGKGGMSSVMRWCFEVWLGIEQMKRWI